LSANLAPCASACQALSFVIMAKPLKSEVLFIRVTPTEAKNVKAHAKLAGFSSVAEFLRVALREKLTTASA
jgi:hypothetical protein